MAATSFDEVPVPVKRMTGPAEEGLVCVETHPINAAEAASIETIVKALCS